MKCSKYAMPIKNDVLVKKTDKRAVFLVTSTVDSVLPFSIDVYNLISHPRQTFIVVDDLDQYENYGNIARIVDLKRSVECSEENK